MAILDSTSIDITKVKTRWKEPYVSEAVNRALSTMPKGIYHGFVLTPDGGTIVRLVQDSQLSESAALVDDVTQGIRFMYREDTEVTFDLTSYAGQQVYIFIYVNYTVGLNTVAEYRVVDSAELVNAWVNSATLLGTVRVPSAGAIALADIEQATAEFAGLSGSDKSRWISVNRNPTFNNGLAGYRLGSSDPASYFAWSSGDVRLGDISGAQPSPDSITLRKDMPITNISVGDYVHVRVRARSENVANGAFLQLRWGDQWDQTIIDDNVASYQDYGFVYQWTGAETGFFTVLALEADLTAAANATGHFFIESVEIFVLRMSGFVDEGEQVPGFEAVAFADKTETAYGTLDFDAGGGNRRTFAFTTYDNGDIEQIVLQNDAERAHTASMPSLVGADNYGVRTAQSLDVILPKAMLTTSTVVSDGTSGGANVDIAAFTVRGSAGTPSSDTKDRYYEQSAVVDFPLPVSGGTEEFYVAWDPSTQGITAFLTANLGANPDVVLLAYVVHNGTVNTRIVNVQETLKDLQQKLPLTVGSTTDARFRTLEAAFRVAEATGFQGPLEFVVVGSAGLGGGSLSGDDVTVTIPDGAVIRGVGTATGAGFPARVNVGTNQAGTDAIGIEFPSGGRCTIKDIEFRYTAGGATNVTCFADTGGRPERVVMENVVVAPHANQSAGFKNVLVCSPTQALVLRDCFFQARSDNAAVNPSNGAGQCVLVNNTTDALRVEITGCTFGGESLGDDWADNGQALDITNNSADATTVVSGCRFLQASAVVFFREVRDLWLRDCYSRVPINIDANATGFVGISNIQVDVASYLFFSPSTSGFMLTVDSADKAVINGVDINALDARVSKDTLMVSFFVDTMEAGAISNVRINHTEGFAFRMTDCQNCVVNGLTLESDGGQAGRRAVDIVASLNVNGGNNYTNIRVKGYGTDAAFESGLERDIWSVLSVDQSGGSGFIGFGGGSIAPNVDIFHDLEKPI